MNNKEEYIKSLEKENQILTESLFLAIKRLRDLNEKYKDIIEMANLNNE